MLYTGRVDIDWDSKVVRTPTPPPEYAELARQDVVSTTVRPDHTSEHFAPRRESVKGWAAKLNILIQVVGSRGDVQPFIALGNELQRYGHRVRLATHDMFENFVRESGLEFYPIGGDPIELMAYMVKTPGLIPSMESFRAGEIRRKRIMIREMLDGCWESCIKPDLKTGHPFVADAIIANPPSFAHVHCAQALSIPVHLMFTMPWSKTKSFPHPLANFKAEGADQGFKNYASYDIVNWLTWQGVGDVINRWRKELDLDEVAMFEGPHLAEILKVPFTYCWSPALLPKPSDWPSYIDVCGFFFRDAPSYDPPTDLQDFISSGPPPVYIGFGSIVLEDLERVNAAIHDAINATGVRAIISKGWSNLSGKHNENIFYIEDCPHEWLFQHVAAVIHHGGAGTTACGLRNARPTVIIPFFGDQPFWGAMVAAAGAGPVPILHQELNADVLAEGIRYCFTDRAITAASSIAVKMASETGVQAAVSSFHSHLPLERLSCDVCPGVPAVWSYSKGNTKVKLSKVAVATLVAQDLIHPKQLQIHELKPIVIENRRWDPITGGASAVVGTTTELLDSILGLFYKPFEEYKDYKVGHRDRPRTSTSSQDAQGPINSSSENRSPQMIKNGDNSTRSMASIENASSDSVRHGARLAGRMAGASVKSLANFVPTALKGMTVDIPLAMTEGMRNVPRLYGEKPQHDGCVTGIKSGFALGGTGFALGMVEAVSDVVVKPYQGFRKDGAKGAVTGVGKGMANMTTKAGCAMFGVLVYPGVGIAKSLKSAIYFRTKKSIVKARHAEGAWLLASCTHSDVDSYVISFDRLLKGKGT
ncbi:Sterol 3-beta-glucosyltransferase UGT80B1 [Penicillium rolfsii]|nr:Sterol 3-beta-glucosyltransferase UGT80B1 [Penicillium rolfsii]